jgi:pyruvate ferredoxin oxidoreductase gamma subunit
VLARAFFAEGREVQSFSTYGGARRGTPVSAFIRVDDKPIRERCDIERADALLCFDASLLEPRLLACTGPDTLIVVNSRRPAAQFAAEQPGRKVIPVDGIGISQRHGLGRIVNSALLGAFARALRAPAVETLSRVVFAEAPAKADENLAACLEGYRAVQAQLERAAA